MNSNKDPRRVQRIATMVALALAIPVVSSTALEVDEPVGPDPAMWDASRVVIGFDDGIPASVPTYLAASGGEVVMEEPVLGFMVVSVDPSVSPVLLEAAHADPRVAYAELDAIMTSQFSPDDMLWNQQWGAWAMKLYSAWDTTTGSHDVQVHILDTGIDHSHLDLMPNLSPQCNGPTSLGWSAIGVGKPGGQESGYHGTHVAGIAGAVIDNRLGVAGTSQSCMTSVQVLAADTGLASWVAAGVRWSTDNGAHVISMSLGGDAASGALHSAVRYAEANGVLTIAAAGNDDCAPVGYPAAHDEVMAVGALEAAARIAPYSSCGPEVEISAPGSGIWSTTPGNSYAPLSGTSMATPYVTGVAALAWSVNATLTHEEVRCILTATAKDLGPGGHDDEFGWGRLNPVDVVDVAQDPVAARAASDLNVSRGVCSDDLFQASSSSALFDPGHAYVDTDNDALFTEVDVPVPDAVIQAGTFAVENGSHGLVVPASVGAIAASQIDFRTGPGGHLVLRADLDAQEIALSGGSLLDVDGIQMAAEGRTDLASGGRLSAEGASIVGDGIVMVEAAGALQMVDATVTSTEDRVFAVGHEIDARGATIQGQGAVRLLSSANLQIAETDLASVEGNVRLDSGGIVAT